MCRPPSCHPLPHTWGGCHAPGGWGYLFLKRQQKKRGKRRLPAPRRRPVAAKLLRRCLLSSQERALNGSRCVAFPAALTGQSQKHGRRRRRRGEGGRVEDPWREGSDPDIACPSPHRGPNPGMLQRRPGQSPCGICTHHFLGSAFPFLAV